MLIGLINSSPWDSYAFSFTLAMADTYPLAVNLLVLLYIEPYRRRVYYLLGIQNTTILTVRATVTTYTSEQVENSQRVNLNASDIFKFKWLLYCCFNKINK
ncbi:hypothetical protein M3Y97_01132700 [Aphelenchoides bicaudatus]|nr:hypothetical protein M3Y97_01132700 [Aphelenchoides bicaudatus]